MSAAALPPTPAVPAVTNPAEAKAREFLALERVAARGNLPVTARFTRAIGASTDDRFRTAEEARKLPPATVMARYAHERETYNKESTPAFVKGVFAHIEELKTRAFANLRRLLDEYVAPVDMSADFERVMREARQIPLEARAFAERERVADELYAFLQWFRGKYTEAVDGVRASRYVATATLARALPTPSKLAPGFGERLEALKRGGRRHRKTRKQKRDRRRKTRRSQRR